MTMRYAGIESNRVKKVERADGPVPQEDERGQEGDERDDHGEEIGVAGGS